MYVHFNVFKRTCDFTGELKCARWKLNIEKRAYLRAHVYVWRAAGAEKFGAISSVYP